MRIDNRKFDAMRELSVSEVDQVSGGTITVFPPPPGQIPHPLRPKPLQG